MASFSSLFVADITSARAMMYVKAYVLLEQLQKKQKCTIIKLEYPNL